MDSNSNPITNANPGMPAIPNPPAPAPVVPTPSDAMPSIPTPVDNTPAPTPATSSVPTFTSSNPAAEAAPVVPTTSSTPTSFGLDSSYNTGYNTTVSSTNSSFDPSSVASFFTPETPSIANGGMIAATEPITEPDPIPEPDPIEVELNAPFQAAAPVPGSIGSAVSVPKEGEEAKNEKAQSKKGGLFGKKSAAKEEKVETPAEAPAPVDANAVLDSNSAIVSLEPIVNPNNPFLNQNTTPAPVPTQPVVAPEPVAMAPAAAVEPIAQAPQVAPVTPVVPATPELQPEVQMAATPEQMPVAPAVEAPAMSDASMMGAAPAPEIPQLDPNNPLPMPGDPMMGNPMLENPMMQNPMMPDPMMMADPTQAMAPASPDMPFAFDSANTQMNPFAEAASLNANSNIPIGGAPEKAKNNKKLLIIAGSAVAVLLIGVVAVVAMSGNGGKKSPSKVADNPTPAPQPTVPTSGTTICTKKYDEDRLALFTGAENGSKNITIKYKDDLIDSISMNDTIDFDNETSRKSGLRTLKDEYNADFEKYGIEDDTAFSTEYVRDVLSITGTRSLASVSSLDPSIVKLFGIISSDGDFVAEDTVADLEEKGYTCSEKGSSAKDDETEIDEEAEESEDLVKEEGSDDAEETLESQEPVDEFVF